MRVQGSFEAYFQDPSEGDLEQVKTFDLLHFLCCFGGPKPRMAPLSGACPGLGRCRRGGELGSTGKGGSI